MIDNWYLIFHILDSDLSSSLFPYSSLTNLNVKYKRTDAMSLRHQQ